MVKPTDSELEVLQLLWSNQPCSVREINDFLNENRIVGYTTTLKIMQIMFEKGLVLRDTNQRSHLYTTDVEEHETKSGLLKEFVFSTFKGSTTDLVLSALGNNDTTLIELQKIKLLIDRLENDQS